MVKLVPTAELARALNVAPRTVQHWRQHRGLEPDAVTLGGHARWDIERVKAWVRDQLANGKTSAQGQRRASSSDTGDDDAAAERRPQDHER